MEGMKLLALQLLDGFDSHISANLLLSGYLSELRETTGPCEGLLNYTIWHIWALMRFRRLYWMRDLDIERADS